MGKAATEDPSTAHRRLAQQLAELDHAYYVRDAPRATDREYDQLFSELKAIEAAHPELVSASSPTQRVGAQPREGMQKVAHQHAMFSLDNTYNESELREFDRRVRDGLRDDAVVRYVTEPKLDGASLTVTYRKTDRTRAVEILPGRGLYQDVPVFQLELAATRGDGRVGEVVTDNVRTIRSVPLELVVPTIMKTLLPNTLTLRGEVVLFKRDFDAINKARAENGELQFANPRNTASGWLRLLDTRETAARPLRVFFYDLVERAFPTHRATLDGLAALGLPTHKQHKVCESLEEVLAFIGEFAERRDQLPYETDGVVIKVDELAQRDLLGTTSRFPRWAIAYKYEAERVQTIVREITCDLGRTGALTPVAMLGPVAVSGSTVSRASLHNIDYVAEKDVRIGDTVTIEKAGEIIPQVLNVELALRPPDTTPWTPPSECPVCATAVVRVAEEAALRCPNVRCPGRLKALIFYFTRRSGMDVDRLGDSLIDLLVDQGLLRDVADVFGLAQKRALLLELPRMGEKSCDNLLQGIEAAKTSRTFSQLLTALGIPLVGAVAAKLVAQHYQELSTLLAVPPERIPDDLAEIHGLGPKMLNSLVAYFGDPEQRAIARKLLDLGVIAREPERTTQTVTTGPLLGKSFCVTGVLSKPREVIHAAIQAAGGEIHDRVKKGTTYLVAGAKVGDTKLKAAKKNGAEVIDEPQLESLISGQAPEATNTSA